jgi:hypothetical protein
MVKRKTLWKTVVILIMVTLMSVAVADEEIGNWTGNFALGYHHWNAVGDLDTEPLGSFDDGGWNAVGSFNHRWREVGRGDLLFGIDLGFMSNDSDIRVPGDIGELAADIFFLTPSMTWSVGGRRSKRLNLEAGAGLYWAEIKEFWNSGYGVQEGTQHFEEIAPGGFLGISADFPITAGRDSTWAINLGARVHYADFGEVGALGRDLGNLDGPITTVQIGVTYDW